MTTLATGTVLDSKLDMQHRLFAELSAMFGREVPLYDRSLLVNRACNRAVCSVIGTVHPGLEVSDAELERTSGERHGAIRIGRPDEYRWMGRLFACFAMEPHGFYDMTSVGAKSQPMIATAFRSVTEPEHRVFTSLLMTDYFDASTRARIEGLLASRSVFSDRAKELVEKSERQGGLSRSDADLLIAECTGRIFRWTGTARDHGLYRDLVAAGFKIAADIACFGSHHLNHLTPNTLCMDLYTVAMKRVLGEVDAARFRARACTVLARLARRLEADRHGDWIGLHFRHITREEAAAWPRVAAVDAGIDAIVDSLAATLAGPDFSLDGIAHAGSKDSTEGPSEDTPVFLRQDAYRALTEPVDFTEPDGSVVHASHTARFGEIEERFHACTPAGRALYDACLVRAEAARDAAGATAGDDAERAYASAFAAFPKSPAALVAAGLVHARFTPTAAGLAARESGAPMPVDRTALVEQGFVEFEALRYEDFLPVSAAGIFASNLQQYGTKSTAASRATYTRALLEEILGKPVVDPEAVYAGIEAESWLATLDRLGLLARVAPREREELERRVAALRAI